MKDILLATDGSSHAESALDVAAALAIRDGASIHVVHVVTDREPNEAARTAVEVEFADELIERSRSAMLAAEPVDDAARARMILSRQGSIAKAVNSIIGESILARTEQRLHRRDVGKVTTRLAEGEPAARILECADERGVDAIVMGSHGHGRLEGMLMGSVSQAVAHRARCTVITVK